MKKATHALVIGNWKMNPQSVTMATRLATDVKKGVTRVEGVEVVLAPPSVYLEAVHRVQNGSKSFALCAQNVHAEKLGAHTGEISLSMLKSFDVTYVILGHSERRAEGEQNQAINKKVHAALKEGIKPVVCIGEQKRDREGHYLTFIETQIREVCAGITKAKLGNVVIAYEPIWAIGTGENATPEDVHEIKLFIQKVLFDIYDRATANRVRVLYGGSVTAKNALAIMEGGLVDGFLVGGSSLNAVEFSNIVKATL